MKHYLAAAIAALFMVSGTDAGAATVINTDDSSFERISPDPVVFTYGADFDFFSGSGAGSVTGSLSSPSAAGGPLGCAASDFAGFVAGSIALIERGACFFSAKAQNAFDAGAIAVIVYNDGLPGRSGLIGGNAETFPDGSPTNFSLPVLSVGYDFGLNLASQTGATFRINAVEAIAPVPLPAGLPLLLAGFGAFGILHGRRRRSREPVA